GVFVNCRASYAGDILTFGSTGQSPGPTPNKQGFSYHLGRSICAGCVFEYSFGQAVANTAVSGFAAAHWLLGCIMRNSVATTGAKYGYEGQGTAGGTCETWLDTCQFDSNSEGDIIADAGGVVNVFNTTYSTVVGTVTEYDPSDPG